MKNSTFTANADDGDNCPVMINVPGTLTMDNCTVSGDCMGVLVRAGDATITNCTITATGDYADNNNYENAKDWGSGNEVPMAAIIVGSQTSAYKADATCQITDTTINAPTDNSKPAVYVSSNKTGTYDSQLTISGEKTAITGDVVVADGSENTPAVVVITDSATVTGNIKNNSSVSSVAVTGGATLTGNVIGENSGPVYVEGKEDGNVVAMNTTTGMCYTDLSSALDEAEDNDTIVLVADITDITLTGTSGYTQAFDINKSITLDGQNHKITVKEKTGEGHVHVLGINADNVTVKNLTIDGGDKSRSGISVYQSKGIKLENVTSQNNTASGVVVNNSAVTADGLKIAGNGWHGVNVDPKDGESASIVLTNADLRDTNGIQVDNGTRGRTATVTIESGYISKVTDTTGSDAGTTVITVNGGSFGESVAEYVKEGLKYEANANGTYTYHETLDAALAVSNNVSSVAAAKPGATVVTVTVKNGNDVTTIKLTSGTEYQLPDYPDRGYNHFVGWTDQAGKHYNGGDAVKITADTTFTAQWSYIPPANPNYKITIGAMENGTVTANPTAAKAGATVTLTPVPDEGYALSTLTVTDRFGDAVRVTENSDGTYTFTMPNGQVTVNATFVETEPPVDEPFVDVAEGDWFYDAVVYAYQNELMDGVGGNRFAPNSETTRAQLVTILYRLEGQPAVSGDLPFTDVETGIWYTDAILWAAQNNIVNSVSDTEFAPGDDLTRQQLVTILYRYAEAKGYDVSASADLSGYPDADQVQDYAQPAMAWAVAENIIQGMEDGTLKPAGNASRAQIATILMRFCEDVAQ